MAGLLRAGVLTGTDSREPQLCSGCVHVTLATATQAGTLVIRPGQLNRTVPHCQADLPRYNLQFTVANESAAKSTVHHGWFGGV